MTLKDIRIKLIQKKADKIKKKIDSDSKMITSQYNIKSFRIIKGEVNIIDADIFNGALNSSSKRLYLKSMFFCNPQGFISYLKELSYDVDTIQLEFDNYNDSCNVEVEVYINDSINFAENHINLGDNPTSVHLNSDFFKGVIALLNNLVTSHSKDDD